MPPTESNLRRLEQQAKVNPATKLRANIPGSSIMDSILVDVSGSANPGSSINNIPKRGQTGGARSQAFSTGSMFSQMRAGTFFKMVDSPFKMSIINAYDKLQNKATNSPVGGGSLANSGLLSSMMTPK